MALIGEEGEKPQGENVGTHAQLYAHFCPP